MRMPQKFYPADTAFKIEWNVLVDALISMQPVDGPGVSTSITPFGTARQVDARKTGSSVAGETVDVTVCDPSTGQTKVYRIVGQEVTT